MRQPAPVDTDDYDEFGLLRENAEEMGLAWSGPPPVRRTAVDVGPEQAVSVIVWGDDDPALVFLHGGGQNAHTWDSVVLALGRPAIAIDLPGHGRSDRRADRNYGPWSNADAIATVMEAFAPNARGVVGMSLGGATTIRLAAQHPELTRAAVIVDVTPQVNDPARNITTEERGSVALISGPRTYASFDEMLAASVAASPQRAVAAVRRGVRHNALRRPDDRWTWRYDLHDRKPEEQQWTDFTPLWDDVSAITVPTMLVRGGDSVFVRDEDVEEFRRRLPAVRVEVVARAGHAIQSDQPLALAKLIEGAVTAR
jgi:pimeloyl-ACP methyl ester carboxylesterase